MAEATAATRATGARGMRQSIRVLCFALLLVAFLGCTYFAFARSHFRPVQAREAGFFSAAWWLSRIEFNPAGRVHRVESGVDFSAITALEDGRDIWIAGTKGLVLHSEDGGESWRQLPTVTASPYAPRAPVKLSSRRRSNALPARSEVLQVSLGEVAAPTPSVPPDVQQFTLPSANEMAPNSAVPAPRPQQQQQQLAPPNESLNPAQGAFANNLISNSIGDLQFVSPVAAFAATAAQILRSGDGGKTWQMVRPADFPITLAQRVKFIDGNRGVITGTFGVSSTSDGGESWSTPAPPGDLVMITDVALTGSGLNGYAIGGGVAELRETPAGAALRRTVPINGFTGGMLFSITQREEGSFFACGSNGVVLASGITTGWQVVPVPTKEGLNSITFSSPARGWIAGENGTILATSNGGATWQAQESGTTTWLRDIHFTSPDDGFAAGMNGTVIRTRDGGATWSPLVNPEPVGGGQRHAWLPPPWFFVSLLVLFGLVRRIPDEVPPPTRAGIGELLVSDKPLAPEDPDYFGFREVAWGLSNYLRNSATKPPLTIAITGEWGMGKSSLMNLVSADLRHWKFRPVWFNAWHHQTEEHLLAALLENIRTQAIPAVTTPEGAIFHARLLWLRARKHPIVTLLVVAGITISVSYFAADPARLLQPTTLLQQVLANPLQWNQESGGGQSSLLVLASAVASLWAFLKGFKPFGVDPAKLLASKSVSARSSDLRAQTSFRYRFAKEFAEVTASLNPLTLVLFVDDLDRCRPEQVYDVLESVNFLVSCGDCFVVMGLARRRVERCVGLVFEKVAAEGPGEIGGRTLDDAEKRRRFARQYLEKLINIEVPVPKGEPGQLQTLLVSRKPEPPPASSRFEAMCGAINRALPNLLPLAVSVIAVAVGLWMSQALFEGGLPNERKAVSSTAAAPAVAPTPAGGFTPPPVGLPTPAPAVTPDIGSATFTPGRTGGAPWWAIFLLTLLVLTPGVIQLSRRSGSVIEDSPAFVHALEEWFPLLATGSEMTPRAVKRFVNRVRYFAMMEGKFQPALRWWERLARWFRRRAAPAPEEVPLARTGEDMLVALATVHERHPEWFAGGLEEFREAVARSTMARRGEIERVDSATFEHFRRLIAGVEVR